MVKRSVRVRLNDMLGAVDGVIEIVEGLAFEDYQRHFVFRRAVAPSRDVSKSSAHCDKIFSRVATGRRRTSAPG